MVDCPSGRKIIEWQYQDKDKQFIIGADRYTLERDNSLCPTRYHLFGTYRVANLNNCTRIGYWRTSFAVDKDDAVTFVPELTNQNTWGIRLYNGVFSLLRPINENAYNNNYLPDLRNLGFSNYRVEYPNRPCINTNFPYGYDPKSIKFVRADGSNETCNKCVLKIFKNNQLVLEKSYLDCPDVEEYCEDKTCPKGSCRCEQSDVVCCYDPKTGRVVKSFKL